MPKGTVEIIDAGGWRKVFPLDKNIIHIGSDARNDIVIEASHGAGLAARQMQLITSASSAQGYRLINIGPVELHSGEDAARLIAPRSVIDLTDGEVIKLGDYTFIFRRDRSAESALRGNEAGLRPVTGPIGLPTPAVPISTPISVPVTANVISAALNLPNTRLAPDQVVEGSITIKNLGDKPGVQFKLEVDGLAASCYEVGPGPILFPNAEKQVAFRARHPMQPAPPAGDYRFTVRVTAPASYPGAAAVVDGVLTILPFIKHELKLSFTE